MIKYDFTYCASSCTNTECFRHKSRISPETDQHESRWIAWADFARNGCEEFMPEKEEA